MLPDGPPSGAALRESLASLGLPPGLVSPAMETFHRCDSRLWILDNSSRMRVRDSHVAVRHRADDFLAQEGGIKRVDGVSRWKELQECVAFHSRLAAQCRIPTRFWTVNDPAASAPWTEYPELQRRSQRFGLCCTGEENVGKEATELGRIMNRVALDRPGCDLTSCLRSLSRGLARRAAGMEEDGRHVALVICTQGRPMNEDGECSSEIVKEFREELSAFAKLPVRVVVRLCTDNEFIIRDIFNPLDLMSDSIDVLDDYWGESEKVYLHNPWLTYTMGMHRLRELVLAPQVIDRLNEEPLGLEAIYEICEMLFSSDDGVGIDLPHPKKDWDGFVWALEDLVERDVPQWNPIKKRMTPWIDVEKLVSTHQGGESSSFLRNSLHKKNAEQPQKQQCSKPTPGLPEALKQWSRQPPQYDLHYPLPTLLVTVPRLFPPTNAAVEPHGYFSRWPIFDEGAFAEEHGEGLRDLLRRAVRKAKFFLHPDKLPSDLTENQKLLFETMWFVIQDREAAYLK